MKALALYFRYALRSFVRGRTRSVFGAFCVAVGVASVVALGLVGANFQSAMSGSGRVLNRGDVSFAPNSGSVSVKDYCFFARLKAQGRITDYTAVLDTNAQISKVGGAADNFLLGDLTAVDGKKFPFYDTATFHALSPLLAHRNGVAVSRNLVDRLHVRIGDRIRVNTGNGRSHVYTVSGVAPDNVTGHAGSINPIVTVDRADAGSLFSPEDGAASKVFVTTRDAAQASAAKQAIEQRFSPLDTVQTAAEAQKSGLNTATTANQYFRLMGLLALVIGGIGIINTMLVAARRRTKEIAILKAQGMKGRQVMAVFLAEAGILALTGIGLGVPVGTLASLAVNSAAQAEFPTTSVRWSLHPEPLIAGALVGLVATLLFSYLPVLRASKARPIAALRSDSVGLPKQGWFRSLLVVLGLAGAVGYLGMLYTGLFNGVQALEWGVAAGIGTLAGAALIAQLFLVVVWGISKFPSLGRLSARMALRSMGTQKRRLSSTLLALCVGIAAMGSAVLLGQSFSQSLDSAVKSQNVNLMVASNFQPAQERRLDAALAHLPGILHRENGAQISSTLATVDGKSAAGLLRRALTERTAGGKLRYSKSDVSMADNMMAGLGGRDLRTNRTSIQLSAGRNLDRRDVGTDHIVVPQMVADPLGIKVGSHLTFGDGGRQIPFTVVGIDNKTAINVSFVGPSVADVSYLRREGLTTPSVKHERFILLHIRDTDLSTDVIRLHERVPAAITLNVSSELDAINKILDQFKLFPEAIAGLALFAGVVIIANTVALAMLERRREIGVMKAVGAKRRTILQFLLVENGIVGFLGALMGVALAVVAVSLTAPSLGISFSADPMTIAGLVLLGVLLALGASSITALPASSEKPLTVLRYE